MIPICYDLYCGLGGWAEGFLSEGYRRIGYDIEKHDYGTGTYPGELILCDVRSIHGSQCKDAAVIVASPPCQEPSYRAMPWSRAKALNAIGPPHNFIELFNACFRIQREASEAAGHYIPLIVENVRGAQRWVGRARWHFGSYYLWGDVPALMPITVKHKVPGFRFDGSGGSFQTASVKATGQNWNRYTETGEVSPHWRMEGLKTNTHGESIKNNGGSWFNVAHNTVSGRGQNPVHNGHDEGLKGPKTKWRDNGCRASNRMTATDEIKLGGDWFNGYRKGQGPRNHASKSSARARAEIAKIPFPLAQHIARCFRPQIQAVSA
jgi:hypothetical protein